MRGIVLVAPANPNLRATDTSNFCVVSSMANSTYAKYVIVHHLWYALKFSVINP